MALSPWLLLVLLLGNGSSGVAGWNCSPGDVCSQARCADVHVKAEEGCYDQPVDKARAGDRKNCLPCSNTVELTSLPAPSNLTLTVRPYTTTYFELHISWNPPSGAEDLEGYKITILAPQASDSNGYQLDNEQIYGCHCVSKNVTEVVYETSYSYQNLYQMCNWDIKRSLRVEINSVPYAKSKPATAATSIPWPTDCLSIDPPDYAICGPPLPDPPKTTVVTKLLPSSPGFMEAIFNWEEPDNTVPGYVPSEYFVVFSLGIDILASFRVKNATSVSVFPINVTESYYAFIQVYLPCVVGNEECSEQNEDYSCSELSFVDLVGPLLTPSSTSIAYTSVASSSLLLPTSSTSGRLSSALSSLTPSTSSTTTDESTGAPFPTATKLGLVVGGSCLASVLLLVVFFVVILFLVKKNGVCSGDYRGRSHILPTSPTDSERSTPIYPDILPIGSGFDFPDSAPAPKMGTQTHSLPGLLRTLSPSHWGAEREEQDSTPMPEPPSPRHRVVFIYSDRTPPEDCDLIAVYRRKLESQGDITTSIYDVSLRQATSTWLAKEVQGANAIFCVCNKEFLADWQTGGGCLSHSPVHALKLQVDSCVNSRLHPAMLYAVVVLYEGDIKFVPEGSYLKAAVSFILRDDKLKEIIRFIRQEREYILPS